MEKPQSIDMENLVREVVDDRAYSYVNAVNKMRSIVIALQNHAVYSPEIRDIAEESKHYLQLIIDGKITPEIIDKIREEMYIKCNRILIF